MGPSATFSLERVFWRHPDQAGVSRGCGGLTWTSCPKSWSLSSRAWLPASSPFCSPPSTCTARSRTVGHYAPGTGFCQPRRSVDLDWHPSRGSGPPSTAGTMLIPTSLATPIRPVLEGYWKVQLYNVGLYKKAAHDAETLRKYSRDIKVDRWDKVLFDHGFVGLGPWLLRFLGTVRLALGAGGGRRPRRQLPALQLRHKCHRAPFRQEGLPRCGHQQPVAGPADVGRGAPLEPSCGAHVGQVLLHHPSVRPRLAGDPVLQEARVAPGPPRGIHLTAAAQGRSKTDRRIGSRRTSEHGDWRARALRLCDR